MATFVPDPAGMLELTRSPTGVVGKDLAKRGARLVVLAKGDVGKKSRRLQNTIHSEMSLVSTGLMVTVGSPSKIALLHHNGTRPHIIVGKRGGALRFAIGGRIIYDREVRHPGTKGNPFLTKNLRRVVLT